MVNIEAVKNKKKTGAHIFTTYTTFLNYKNRVKKKPIPIILTKFKIFTDI